MLEKLVFRTAIPFGYAAFWSGLLLVAVIGLVLAISSAIVPRLRPWGLVVGVGMLSVVGAFVAANIWFDAAVEMNPFPVDRAVLEGTWRDGDAVLVFRSDGTFRLDPGWLADRLKGHNSHGEWKLDDWNLTLLENGGRPLAPLRVIRFRREYRIIVDDFEDPDMWDGRLGFRREESIRGNVGLTSNPPLKLTVNAVTGCASARPAPARPSVERQC